MLVVCGASVRDRSDIVIKILYAANCTASFSWRGVRATADADGQLRLQRTCVAAPVISPVFPPTGPPAKITGPPAVTFVSGVGNNIVVQPTSRVCAMCAPSRALSNDIWVD